jgi:hypothetical protein
VASTAPAFPFINLCLATRHFTPHGFKEQARERVTDLMLPLFEANANNRIQIIFRRTPVFLPNFDFSDGSFSRTRRRRAAGAKAPALASRENQAGPREFCR